MLSSWPSDSASSREFPEFPEFPECSLDSLPAGDVISSQFEYLRLPPLALVQDADLSASFQLEELVGRGRYGSVWKAKLNDHEVAVKIFGAHNKQYYLNECDIYTLPHMDNSSILKFIGKSVSFLHPLNVLAVICHFPECRKRRAIDCGRISWIFIRYELRCERKFAGLLKKACCWLAVVSQDDPVHHSRPGSSAQRYQERRLGNWTLLLVVLLLISRKFRSLLNTF